MLISQQKSDITNIRSLLLIHFFICSIGLLGFINHVADEIGQTIFWPINVFISYREWALLSNEPTKPIELLQYALSVSAMVFYYSLVVAFIKNSFRSAEKVLNKVAPTRVVLICYFGFLLLLNIWLLIVHGGLADFSFAFWFFILVLPIMPLVNSWLDRASKGGGLWYIAIFASLIASLVFSFYPYLAGELAISNDYMDIPEQTRLTTGLVDNTDYVNTHRIGGLHKYDPRLGLDKQSTLMDGDFIRMKKSNVLTRFIEYDPQKFSYDERSGALIVNGSLTEVEVDHLAKMAVNEGERSRIYSFYYDQLTKLQAQKYYSPEEIEFIRKNRRESLDQALAGHYFHHQNTMFGTINEYDLGKPQNQTVFLYGWLSTVVIAKAMNALGGITFESYLKAFYSFYPLYYLLIIVAAAIVFKRVGYAVLVGLISVSSLYLVGFETIRFAPGFNPVRHFFDIFALVCFYWYLFKPRWNLLYLALALAFSIVDILFCKEFGVVLLLSMLATIVIRMLVDQRKSASEIILIIVAILATLASLLLIKTGKNPTLLYVLMGVSAPPMHRLEMYGLLLLFSTVYVYLIKNRKTGDNWCYLSLLWFFYAQSLLIYYIWNPAPNHILSLGTVWGMLFALLLRHWNSNYDWAAKYEKKMLLALNSILVFSIFLPSIGSYYIDQRNYQKIFTDHKLYHWNFPSAQFISTMDPSVFENAVQLINKYSRNHSIYILSKYDNILPFLSAKYSAMPFIEMDLSLVTQKEIDQSVNLIRHDRPEYLFVDTDMARNHAGDVYDKNDPINMLAGAIYNASRGRAMMLDNFAKVFSDIRDLYEPVETGNLITVYRRRAIRWSRSSLTRATSAISVPLTTASSNPVAWPPFILPPTCRIRRN